MGFFVKYGAQISFICCAFFISVSAGCLAYHSYRTETDPLRLYRACLRDGIATGDSDKIAECRDAYYLYHQVKL